MGAPRWQLDDSRWPIAVMSVVDSDGHAPPDPDTFFQALERLRDRVGRRAVVIDLTHTAPDAMRRKRFVEWTTENLPDLQKTLICAAGVAPNPLQRGLITGVTWFVTAPCPTKIFATRAEALLWSAEQVERPSTPIKM